jgi:hypothetical protein
MVKNAMVSIRVAPEVKERLEKAAMLDGRSVASYVERLLDSLHQSLPRWILRDCYPIHRNDIGPRVVLSIAVGMPTAMLTADHAEALGKQLIAAAQMAEKLPPA